MSEDITKQKPKEKFSRYEILMQMIRTYPPDYVKFTLTEAIKIHFGRWVEEWKHQEAYWQGKALTPQTLVDRLFIHEDGDKQHGAYIGLGLTDDMLLKMATDAIATAQYPSWRRILRQLISGMLLPFRAAKILRSKNR